MLASIFYDKYTTNNLFKKQKFIVSEAQQESLGAPWGLKKEETIFELRIDRKYNRVLRTGGYNVIESTKHWEIMSKGIRKIINVLKTSGLVIRK